MDSRKYYYLKLKENFFESDSMILLENMKDGYLYSNILLKLYLRSLKDSGRLMLNNVIPYNAQMLASVTRHQVGTVEKALEIFKELGLIEILDTGAIYMTDIQNFVIHLRSINRKTVVGYVPRRLAAGLAAVIDAGVHIETELLQILGGYSYKENYGCLVDIKI